MPQFLSTIFSLFTLAAKRLWNHGLLMSALLLGLVAALYRVQEEQLTANS